MFELEFDFFQGKNWPNLEFYKEITSSEYLIDSYTKRVNIKIHNCQHKLEFFNTNKNDYDTIVENGKIIRDQSVKLKRIWVDDILLNFNYILPYVKYAPDYKESFLNYCMQNSIPIDYTPYPFELFHNGSWVFTFEEPFWEWYNQVRQKNATNGISQNNIELYIGTHSIDKDTNFKKLKKLLNV